jgi:hypothetical protein
MKSLVHLLPLLHVALALSSKTLHSPLQPPTLKRAYETCEATYGGGSTVGGDPSLSRYCYDPMKGEVYLPFTFCLDIIKINFCDNEANK